MNGACLHVKLFVNLDEIISICYQHDLMRIDVFFTCVV